jgi:hypothetical protein
MSDKKPGRPPENRTRYSFSPQEIRMIIGALGGPSDWDVTGDFDERMAQYRTFKEALLHKVMARAIESGAMTPPKAAS